MKRLANLLNILIYKR